MLGEGDAAPDERPLWSAFCRPTERPVLADCSRSRRCRERAHLRHWASSEAAGREPTGRSKSGKQARVQSREIKFAKVQRRGAQRLDGASGCNLRMATGPYRWGYWRAATTFADRLSNGHVLWQRRRFFDCFKMCFLRELRIAVALQLQYRHVPPQFRTLRPPSWSFVVLAAPGDVSLRRWWQ